MVEIFREADEKVLSFFIHSSYRFISLFLSSAPHAELVKISEPKKLNIPAIQVLLPPDLEKCYLVTRYKKN